MKYYVDFEAEQPSGFIREIGCVREDGKEFFSLVNTKKQATAPQIEDACKALIQYMTEDDKDIGSAKFMFWGGNDMVYLHNTAITTTDLATKMCLGIIMASYHNYAKWLSTEYKIGIAPSLEAVCRVLNLCQTQTHNALDDAKLLKSVDETEQTMEPKQFIYALLATYGEEIAKTTKAQYVANKPINTDIPTGKIVTCQVGSQIEVVHANFNEVYAWMLKANCRKSNEKKVDFEVRIKSELADAIQNEKEYCGYVWRSVSEDEAMG